MVLGALSLASTAAELGVGAVSPPPPEAGGEVQVHRLEDFEVTPLLGVLASTLLVSVLPDRTGSWNQSNEIGCTGVMREGGPVTEKALSSCSSLRIRRAGCQVPTPPLLGNCCASSGPGGLVIAAWGLRSLALPSPGSAPAEGSPRHRSPPGGGKGRPVGHRPS